MVVVAVAVAAAVAVMWQERRRQLWLWWLSLFFRKAEKEMDRVNPLKGSGVNQLSHQSFEM